MGWMYTRKPKGEGIIEYLARTAFGSNEHCSWTVLKGKVIKGVAYMAIRRTFPADSGKEPYVFAGIFKTQMCPKSEYNFGYKDMDESEGPYYYECPEDILDLLSPTEYVTAQEWRKLCRDRAAKSKSIKLTAGCLVEFIETIRFSSGYSSKVFRVEDARRGLVVGQDPSGEFSGRLIIRGIRDYLMRGAAKIIPPETGGAV